MNLKCYECFSSRLAYTECLGFISRDKIRGYNGNPAVICLLFVEWKGRQAWSGMEEADSVSWLSSGHVFVLNPPIVSPELKSHNAAGRRQTPESWWKEVDSIDGGCDGKIGVKTFWPWGCSWPVEEEAGEEHQQRSGGGPAETLHLTFLPPCFGPSLPSSSTLLSLLSWDLSGH